MNDEKIIFVEALHHGIPQVIKLPRVFTEEFHASLPIACTNSDKRTVSLVKTYQEKTVRLVTSLNIGINHGFQCSNIRWITRKVFEHKAAGRVFKHLPSDPANVSRLKQTMVDRYSCIFTPIHFKSHENNINNVKIQRKPRSFFNVGHFVSAKHMTSRRIDQ